MSDSYEQLKKLLKRETHKKTFAIISKNIQNKGHITKKDIMYECKLIYPAHAHQLLDVFVITGLLHVNKQSNQNIYTVSDNELFESLKKWQKGK